MFHGIAVESHWLKVESWLKAVEARLPVERLKVPPYISRRDIGGFQPTGQRRLKVEELKGSFQPEPRGTSIRAVRVGA